LPVSPLSAVASFFAAQYKAGSPCAIRAAEHSLGA